MTEGHHITKDKPRQSQVAIDCENALTVIAGQNENEPHGIGVINSWLQTQSKLNEKAKTEWFKYSCFGTLPCSCSDASAEYRLYRLYKLLEEISALHDNEVFFKKQLEVLEAIEKNEDEVKKWLSTNEELMISGFDCLGLDFWDECDKYSHVAFQATMLGKPDTHLYLKREDFVYGIQLLTRFRKIYLNSLSE